MILVEVWNRNELARRATAFGCGIPHCDAQLISSGALNRHVEKVEETVSGKELVSFVAHVNGLGAIDLINDAFVVTDSDCQQIHHGLMPAARLLCERKIARVYVKQQAYEGPRPFVVAEQRRQA